MKKSITRSHRFSAQIFSVFLLVLLVFPIAPPAAIDSNEIKTQAPKAKKEAPPQKSKLKRITASSSFAPTVSGTNPSQITIPDNSSATPYPSTITIPATAGAITKVTVTLNNLTVPNNSPNPSNRNRDLDFLLVDPGGRNFNLMSDAGHTFRANNVTLTLDDSAPNFLSTSSAEGNLTSGTFKPTDGVGGNDAMPPPAPSLPYNSPAPEGSATFASVFNGFNPTGVWSLYVVDDGLQSALGDSVVAGGWTLDITVSVTVEQTTTAISSSPGPSSFTNASVTFTADVNKQSDGTPVTAGNVTFTEDGNSIGCDAVPVNMTTGLATCARTFTTEGNRTIAATYNGTASFATSSDSLVQEVNNQTTVNAGNQYCNTGSILIDDTQNVNSVPYPSKVFVSGLGGSISKVTVDLNDMTLREPREIDLLLVGPNDQKFIIMADTGDLTDSNNIDLTLDDSALNLIPGNNTGSGVGAIPSGTYKPTNYTSAGEPGGDALPSPAPSGPYNDPAPTGSATFATVFNGISPNGTWKLFAFDESQSGGGDSTIAGGWCVNFTTTNDTPTTTDITSDKIDNEAFVDEAVTFTATVTETTGGAPVTSGTVEFRQGTNVLATGVNLDMNGQAMYTAPASTFTEGSYEITADYSGDPGMFNLSSDMLTQVYNNRTTIMGNDFCNTGGITAEDLLNETTPYPSKVFITGLIGEFQKVTIKLNNVNIQPESNDLDIMLVGPNGEEFVILSDVGGTNPTSNATITLDDDAMNLLPSSGGLSTGDFRPSDIGSETFDPPAPSMPQRAEPEGMATFASVFPVGTDPNGEWSLYVQDDAQSGGNNPTIAGGWCVTPTLTPVSTTTTEVETSHPNGIGTNNTVTFTAEVTATTGTPTGMVEFFADGNSLGTAMLMPGPAPPFSGNKAVASPTAVAYAQIMTSFPFAGTYEITATYLGSTQPGGGGFAMSSSPTAYSQLVSGPSSAAVNVSGRVLSGTTGRGIFKARVTLVDAQGQVRYATTNPFGYYQFINIGVGESYTLNVSAKNRSFKPATRVLQVDNDLVNVNFISEN